MEIREEELLRQFERGGKPQKETPLASEGDEYEAFKVVDRKRGALYLRPVGQPLLWCRYGYLLYVLASPSGKQVRIGYNFALVVLTGTNLHEVAEAIAEERCSYVQQFDARHWAKPKDASAPFIASLVYQISGSGDITAEEEQSAA